MASSVEASGQGPPSPFLMLLPNATTSTLDLTMEESTTITDSIQQLDASAFVSSNSSANSAALDDVSSADTALSGSIRSSTGILSSSMPGNVFPQLSNAPIPAFFSTAHRAITVRPNSWYLRATALSSSTIRDSDQYLQPNDTNPNRRGHPRDNTSTSTDTATIETGPPSSSTLWKAWKQQEHANKAARTHRPRRKRSTSSSSSSSSSSLESDTNSSSLHNELVKQVVDYSTKGWFVWFIRLGLVHLCLPFINGVMLGFGEICANEVTIRTGWLGLRALTDNYLHR